MADEPFLRIRNVVKSFGGHRAVDDVSIDIARGEVFALLGSSGCGKTTLLRMLAGFETPTSGAILLEGRDLAGLAPYARPMNMMFQSYALFPHLSVEDNIAFGLRREGRPAEEIATRVAALLKLVQLDGYAQRKPHQLSGGQQQRVALARSLARRPKILLLDEPLGALDRKLREETQIELANIIHEVGVTCVLVTHDQEEAMTMASRIAVMSQGRFMQVGAPAEIYERPSSRFVADFIGNVNLIDGTVSSSGPDATLVDAGDLRVRAAPGGALASGSAASVALRPEKIRIERGVAGNAAASAAAELEPNRAFGVVRDLAYFGSFSVYHVQLDGGRVLKISQGNDDRRSTDRPLARGDAVALGWDAHAPVVLPR